MIITSAYSVHLEYLSFLQHRIYILYKMKTSSNGNINIKETQTPMNANLADPEVNTTIRRPHILCPWLFCHGLKFHLLQWFYAAYIYDLIGYVYVQSIAVPSQGPVYSSTFLRSSL